MIFLTYMGDEGYQLHSSVPLQEHLMNLLTMLMENILPTTGYQAADGCRRHDCCDLFIRLRLRIAIQR